jgi:uncharacterized protein (TIRG00374 family)
MDLKNRIFSKNTIISFILSLIILYYVFSKVDLFKLINTVKSANLYYFSLSFIAFYTSIIIKGYRWRILLKNTNVHLNLKNSVIIYYLSMFINSIVPAKLGDIYRGYLLKKKTNNSITLGIGTVFAERIFDLTSMIIVLVICGYISFKGDIPLELIYSLEYGIIVIVLLILLLISIIIWNKKFINIIGNEIIGNIMINFEKGLRAINIKTLPTLMILSLIGWIVEGLTVYFIFLSLNINLGIIFGIFSDLSSSLLTAVPLTPSGLGIVEYAMVYILNLKGVVESYALAVLILYRAVSYLSIILIGAIINMIYKN